MIVTALASVDLVTVGTVMPGWDVTMVKSETNPAQYEMTLLPNRKFPVGNIKFSIPLIANSTAATWLPKQYLPVSGEIVPDVQTSPSQVIFGSCCLGEIASESITLHSLSRSSFDVSSVQVIGSGLTVRHEEQFDTVETTTYTIVQRIQELGWIKGKVVFKIQNNTNDESRIEIPATYHGISTRGQLKRY